MMSSFSEAFKKARKEKGPGKTFSWNGKSYSTNRADDKKSGSAAPKSSSRPKARGSNNLEQMAKKAIDRSEKTPRTTGPKSDSNAKVTTTKLPPKAAPKPKATSKPKTTTSTNRKTTRDSSPKANASLSKGVNKVKKFGDYMDNDVRPKLRRILGIGADMKPQQKSTGTKGRRSKKRGD